VDRIGGYVYAYYDVCSTYTRHCRAYAWSIVPQARHRLNLRIKETDEHQPYSRLNRVCSLLLPKSGVMNIESCPRCTHPGPQVLGLGVNWNRPASLDKVLPGKFANGRPVALALTCY
jgi:hypothetical protein